MRMRIWKVKSNLCSVENEDEDEDVNEDVEVQEQLVQC